MPTPGIQDMVSVWTDGSALDNGLESCIAGSAWTTEYYIEDSCRLVGLPVTNNIAEVAAVIMALKSWRNHDIHIYTDSTFVLHLMDGGLLAMERDSWPGLPWLYAIAPAISYAALFQHLLFLLRAHGALLEFSKVKAHDKCAGNNCADRLANSGRISGRVLDLSQLYTPPNWVNASPTLNNAALSDITAHVIRHTIHPPIFSTKAGLNILHWKATIQRRYGLVVEPVRYIPRLWTLSILAQLKETIWKHIFGSLPLGHRCHAISDLGRFCRCGTELSLDHMWASCPEYDLGPLLDATNTHLSALTPGIYVKHTDLDGSLYQWFTLLSLTRLDCALAPTKHHLALKEAIPL